MKRDVARLGPAVRAMLTQGSETTTLTPDMEMSLAAVPDDKSLCWSGSKCQRMVVESIDNDEGKTLIEIPMTIGVVGALLLPALAAVGAVAALVTNCTIRVERREGTL